MWSLVIVMSSFRWRNNDDRDIGDDDEDDEDEEN